MRYQHPIRGRVRIRHSVRAHINNGAEDAFPDAGWQCKRRLETSQRSGHYSRSNIVFCFVLTSTGGTSSQLFLYRLEEGKLYLNFKLIAFKGAVGLRSTVR